MIHWKKLIAFVVLSLTCFSCGKDSEPSPADNTKDRQAILTHWADNIIVPSYENFQAEFAEFAGKADLFAAQPDGVSLPALREAWANAYVEWQKVEMFEVGPAEKYTLRNFFNIYPADVNGITANMNDPASNLDVAAAYPTQGFPAIDYLVNGLGPDDAAILTAYTSDADAGKRMAYLTRLIQRMKGLLDNTVSEWKGSYRDNFISSTGISAGSSTALVVNAYVLYYERYVRSGKIGIPSGTGISQSGTPYPEKTEAFYRKGISRMLAQTAHDAARDFFNGVDIRTGDSGPSLASYLDGLGANDTASGKRLSEIINDQFSAVSGELAQLTPDLAEQIATDNQKMASTYAAMQQLVRLLKVDMTSAMSVTITYTDNDGD